VAAMAMASFSTVDAVLDTPAAGAEDYIKVIGPASARTLLRYLVGEQNRALFSAWEWAQLGLGIAVLITALMDSERSNLLLAGTFLLTLVVVAEHFLITPHLIVWGRAIDFLPPEAPSPERYRHAQFHALYSWLEVAKGVIIMGLSARLMFYKSRRRSKSRSSSGSSAADSATKVTD